MVALHHLVTVVLVFNVLVWKVQSPIPQGLYCRKKMSQVYQEEKTANCKDNHRYCFGIRFALVIGQSKGRIIHLNLEIKWDSLALVAERVGVHTSIWGCIDESANKMISWPVLVKGQSREMCCFGNRDGNGWLTWLGLWHSGGKLQYEGCIDESAN